MDIPETQYAYIYQQNIATTNIALLYMNIAECFITKHVYCIGHEHRLWITKAIEVANMSLGLKITGIYYIFT